MGLRWRWVVDDNYLGRRIDSAVLLKPVSMLCIRWPRVQLVRGSHDALQ
jgi:hypothetical protein